MTSCEDAVAQNVVALLQAYKACDMLPGDLRALLLPEIARTLAPLYAELADVRRTRDLAMQRAHDAERIVAYFRANPQRNWTMVPDTTREELGMPK